MAMQVHASCCYSAVTALGAGALPAESAARANARASASCSSWSASFRPLSKSSWKFGVGGGYAVREARTGVSKRGGGAVVVRAGSGGPSGKDENKAVYDAFFLGRALAEAVSERIGSAIGEFLSDVGRRQSEQQKQIREFQDEVQARAAAAALKAAQKALATEKEEEEKTPTSPPPASPSPAQPPPSTSGLSNPDDTSKSISIED